MDKSVHTLEDDEQETNFNDENEFFGYSSIEGDDLLDDNIEDEHEEDFFNDFVSDIDFSEFRGNNFKSSLKKVKRSIDRRKSKSKHEKFLKKRKKQKKFPAEIGVKKHAEIFGGKKTTRKIIVPSDRTVIVEGVSKFILSKDPSDDAARNIGYYKGQKLRELVFHFFNDSALDFNLELFNPSMPLDYLYSTSLNLNDKITVAGGYAASYTDVLHYILANPVLIPNAKCVFSAPIGGDVRTQIAQPLIFKNKNIDGAEKIQPQQLPLKVDNLQFQSDMVYFDLMNSLNRPFIPDGMDVIQYKVLAGYTVTFGFYFKQVSLKKLLFKEAADCKWLF